MNQWVLKDRLPGPLSMAVTWPISLSSATSRGGSYGLRTGCCLFVISLDVYKSRFWPLYLRIVAWSSHSKSQNLANFTICDLAPVAVLYTVH